MNASRARTLLAALLLMGCPTALQSEVRQAAPDGFLSHHASAVKVAPDAIYQGIGRVDRWWSHSWSGNPANLALDLRAGGCFCETWQDGSAEHARVVRAIRGESLVLHGALGPLQEMGVSGVLTFQLEPAGAGTLLTVTYRVSGDTAHGLDKLASIVDKVIGEQTLRLVRYGETGIPQ
jgi:hypothetical protein